MKPDNLLSNASPAPSLTHLPGSDALWSGCMAIAAARRAGTQALLPPEAGWHWSGAGGWHFDAGQNLLLRDLFALLKPILDCRPVARPWVIAQLGQSLDGCIATRTGDARFINGQENLTHLHRLRALADAVIVGAGTVAIDDPQLTTRHVPGPNPVRVLFDPQLQLTQYVTTARVFSDAQAPTLWMCDAQWQTRASALAGAHQVLPVPGLVCADGSVAVAPGVAALHARGLGLLFVEGGGVTVSRFLAQGCLDRLHLSLAPLIIGNGRPGLRFQGADSLGECPRPPFTVFPMGPDQLWDLDLASDRERP